MATTATIKKNIAKLEAALKSKATPKSLKPKLETQLVKSKAELSGINKGTKPKTSSTKSTQTALQKLKAMVNKNKKYKTYKGAGVDLEKDADRPALRTGKRVTDGTHYPYKKGNTYYEYRANRIDVKQPPKKYPKLEKGGELYMLGEEEVYIKDSSIGLDDEICLYYKKDDSILKCISKNSFDAYVEQGKLKPKLEKGGEMAKGGEVSTKLKMLKEKSNGYFPNIEPTKERSYYLWETPKAAKSSFIIESRSVYSDVGSSFYIYDKDYKFLGSANELNGFNYVKPLRITKSDVKFEDGGMMAKGGEMADGGEIYKLADNMTDAEYEKKLNSLNEKQKNQYDILVRLGDSPKLALATTLLSKEAKWDNDTTRAYTMAKGGYMEKGGISDKEVAESNADMVLSQIKAVKHHAQELSNVVSKNSDIEAWVVAKIERASTDLSDITHYLEFQTNKMAMGGEIHRTQD